MNRTLAALLVAAGPALAVAACPDPKEDPRQGWLVALENDYFGRSKIHTDRWYSNGLHYAESFKRRCVPELLRIARDFSRDNLGLRPERQDEGPTVAAFFGQNIYTPRDIKIATPQLSDRPWAGWLYAGIGVFAYQQDRSHRAMDWKLGVVGPASMASQVQRGLHKLIDDDDPAGWAHQLRPRLGLQVSYMHTQRWSESKVLPKWMAIHGTGRATLGTLKNNLSLGLTAIAGEKDRVLGMPDEGDFMAVDFNGRGNDLPPPLDRLTVFAQVQWTAVGSNHFITGRTYGPRPEIELRRSVLMQTLGVSWRFSQRSRLEYRIKRRSHEFSSREPLAPDDDYHSYGEVRWVVDLER